MTHLARRGRDTPPPKGNLALYSIRASSSSVIAVQFLIVFPRLGMLTPSCVLCSSVLPVVSQKSSPRETWGAQQELLLLERDRFVECRDNRRCATGPEQASGAIFASPIFSRVPVSVDAD